MYKNLKFSWAHIVAFLALIGIGYVSFVGLTYAIDDGFLKPMLGTLAILIVLILWFIGAQQLKGIDNDFDFGKCIWWERFLVFTSPLILVACLIPFNHAMNVASESKRIEETFKRAIDSSTKLFDDYDAYAEQRIDNYADFLKRVKQNKDIQPTLYQEIGFDGTSDNKKVAMEVEALTLQLTANYDSLNVVAREWIDRANQKTSVWNVFLVGNIKEIEASILEWSSSLNKFSSVILSTEKMEETEVRPFDADETHLRAIIGDLDSLSNIYKPENREFTINYYIIIWAVVFYLLLMFPYFIQERNGVSTYTLFGRRFMDIGIDTSRGKGPKSFDPIEKKHEVTHIEIDMSSPISGETHSGDTPYEVDESALTKEERRRRREERRAARNKENESL